MSGPRAAVLAAVVLLVVSTIIGMTILVVTDHAESAPSIAAITTPIITLLLLGHGQRETLEKVETVHELVNGQATKLADSAAATIAAKDETIAALTSNPPPTT